MMAALIYDGACPLCLKAVDWLKHNARPGVLDYLACQSPERAERYPDIPEAQCMEAMLLVQPDGTVYAGEEALPHLFRLLRRWRWLARLFALPGISLAAPAAYRFVARNRYIISVIVARKHQDDNASPSKGNRP